MFQIAALIMVGMSISLSQWSTDPNNPFEVSFWGSVSNGCSDGTGGAFIEWTNGGEHPQIFLRRIDRFGNILWNDFIHVGGTGDSQNMHAKIIEDGSGGAIIGFTDLFEIEFWYPFWEYDAKSIVQRIDGSGNKLWGEDGLRVLNTDMDYQLDDMISDGNSGVFVLMRLYELPSGWIHTNVQAVSVQRIDGEGNRLWGDLGVILEPDIGNLEPMIESDGNGGAYVSYALNNIDFVYVHLGSNGNILWEIPYTDAFWVEEMQNAGTDGLFLAGIHSFSTTTNHLVLNYITEDGELPWTLSGIVPYEIESDVSQGPWLTINFDNSLTIGWRELIDGFDRGIIQRISTSGNLLWDSPILFSEYPSKTYVQGIISTKDSCNIVEFLDDRNYPGESGNYQVFVQKVNRNGELLWDDSGIPLTYTFTSTRTLISDQNGGGIIIFNDEPYTGVYAQLVNRYGELGEVITIPGDLNANTHLDVLDIVRTVTIIMGTGEPTTPWESMIGDMNDDELVNVLDIVIMVNIILEG